MEPIIWTAVFCVLTLTSPYVPDPGPPQCSAAGCTTICATSDCRTASGLPAGPELAACGPAWDLGARLDVPGYGRVVCGDRFGAPPDPYAVDLYMPSLAAAHQWALSHGGAGLYRQSVCQIKRCQTCKMAQ